MRGGRGTRSGAERRTHAEARGSRRGEISGLRFPVSGFSSACHFPIGHRSVAMRSLAHVLHPHLRHRPVLLSACASHSGQARHVDSRVASASGGVVEKPEAVHFAPAERMLSIAMRCASRFLMIRQRLSLDLIAPYKNHNKGNEIQ